MGWGALGGLAMGRAVWVGLAARLMYAGRNRSRALRNKLPQTSSGHALRGHSADGDRCCRGGRPAHGHDVLACSQPGSDGELNRDHGSGVGGCRLGPDKPGELTSDGTHDNFAVVFAGIQAAEPRTEPLLGRPRSGDRVGMNTLLAVP